MSLFTSESVSPGHPDKIADQISDAILDECLRQDPRSKVACETLVAGNLVVIAGEITTTANVNYESIARKTIRQIGYDDPNLGFDYHSCEVMISLREQSPDIAMGVEEGKGLHEAQGAGDQGMMFGYASEETDELMPLPITLAHKLMHKHVAARMDLPYLRPDAKAQVSVEYDENERPVRIDTVVFSTQHSPEVEHSQLVLDIHGLIREVIPSRYLDEKTKYHINPTGRFVTGGPVGDCGLTGRKIIVDTYGGMARHGGGCFSGKDPSKVDRSGAYAARYVAKTIVAAGLAEKCEIQIAYAIGVAEPISIKVDTFGTSTLPESRLCEMVPRVFDLTAGGIIEMLDLRRPIFAQTAWGGHFGRGELQLPWESLDRVQSLLEALEAPLEQVGV